MFRVEETEINQIRENADIVEIISSYLPLSQKGKNFFGVCPFHEDHSPSMSVSKEKGIYKCFSCGASGNVFKFVSDFENVSFIESVRIVAEKIGMSLKSTVEIQKTVKYQSEYKIMELASKFFQNNLFTTSGKKAFMYLKERHIDEAMMKEFGLGLSLDKNSLYELLHQKKYADNALESLGLINSNGLNKHDVFVNRIIFPIENWTGEVVGFTGRMYLENALPPKYINSKETVIFKKGNILFNYHRAKDAIRLEKKLILVEGNMDAMRMYSSGIKNVIALMGTSLTSNQIAEIKKMRVPVVLLFDNDDAGLIATYQNGLLLEKENIPLFVVRLSGEKDPDDYIIKHGPEAVKDNIDNAISFLEFKLNYLKKNKNLQDSEGLLKYVKEVLNGMKDNKDELLKEITLTKLSEEYHLSIDVLKTELDKLTSNENVKVQKEEIAKPVLKKTRLEDSIAHILYFMMNDPLYIKMYKTKLGFFDDETSRGMASEIMAYYETHKTINLADFMSYIETSKLKEPMEFIIKSIKDENMDENIMEEYINIVKRTRKENRIKALKQELKTELDSNKKMEIALKMTELKKEV